MQKLLLVVIIAVLAFVPALAEANTGDFTGGVAIGSSYAGVNTAPANGLIVQGNTGIGTTSPANAFDVDGAAVIGSSYAGTDTAPSNGLLVQGNVGIGTTSPAGPLDVEGGTAVSGNGSPINLYAQNGQASGNTNGGSIILMPGTGHGTGVVGAVGIGTTSPGSLLHLYSSNSTDEIVQSTATTGYASLTLEGSSSHI